MHFSITFHLYLCILQIFEVIEFLDISLNCLNSNLMT